MKIVFVLTHHGYCRHYLGVFKALAEAGHNVLIKFNRVKPSKTKGSGGKRLIEGSELLDPLRLIPGIRIDETSLPQRKDMWIDVLFWLRMYRDCGRYFHPDYKNAVKLRKRMLKYASPLTRSLISFQYKIGGYKVVSFFSAFAKFLENKIPQNATILSEVKSWNADRVVFTPLIEARSAQSDYISAANALGLETVLAVASWDNLTNKGLLHTKPKRTLVWNDFQRIEATKYHNVDPKTVHITGSQSFEHWKSWKPQFGFDEFRAAAGIAPDSNGYILYLCSSPFIAEEEVSFVRKLVTAYRNSSCPKLRTVPVVVRPHPQNFAQWERDPLDPSLGVILYPRGGQFVTTDEARELYFCSIKYAKFTVGINSSAMVEAGIINKPVLTILDKQYEDTQSGTIHFHLLNNYGLLETSEDIESHMKRASRLLDDDDQHVDRRLQFVKQFAFPDLPNGRTPTQAVVESIIQ